MGGGDDLAISDRPSSKEHRHKDHKKHKEHKHKKSHKREKESRRGRSSGDGEEDAQRKEVGRADRAASPESGEIVADDVPEHATDKPHHGRLRADGAGAQGTLHHGVDQREHARCATHAAASLGQAQI